MALDDTRLHELLEQSSDLHTDAMTSTRVALDEYVERAHGDPWHDVDAATRKVDVVAAACRSRACSPPPVSGPPWLRCSRHRRSRTRRWTCRCCRRRRRSRTSPSPRMTPRSTLDFIGGASANAVVKTFAQKTKDQHQQHADAFNAASTRLGGKAQDQPDPVLLGVVNNAKPTLTGPAQVVDLALELEDGAAADVRGQHRYVLRQERTVGGGQHHGRRGAARGRPQRGEGTARRGRRPT